MAKGTVIGAVGGKIGQKVVSKIGPLFQRAAGKITHFKNDEIFTHVIQTKKGPVDFMVATTIKNNILTLDDVAIYAKTGEALTGVRKEIFRGLYEIRNFAKEQGFKRLEIRGVRHETSSSVRPGHNVNLGWDLE